MIGKRRRSQTIATTKAAFCRGAREPKAAREREEREARQMNDENEGHKNGGWGNLQIRFSLCPLRSFEAIQFRNSGLTFGI